MFIIQLSRKNKATKFLVHIGKMCTYGPHSNHFGVTKVAPHLSCVVSCNFVCTLNLLHFNLHTYAISFAYIFVMFRYRVNVC